MYDIVIEKMKVFCCVLHFDYMTWLHCRYHIISKEFGCEEVCQSGISIEVMEEPTQW